MTIFSIIFHIAIILNWNDPIYIYIYIFVQERRILVVQIKLHLITNLLHTFYHGNEEGIHHSDLHGFYDTYHNRVFIPLLFSHLNWNNKVSYMLVWPKWQLIIYLISNIKSTLCLGFWNIGQNKLVESYFLRPYVSHVAKWGRKKEREGWDLSRFWHSGPPVRGSHDRLCLVVERASNNCVILSGLWGLATTWIVQCAHRWLIL